MYYQYHGSIHFTGVNSGLVADVCVCGVFNIDDIGILIGGYGALDLCCFSKEPLQKIQGVNCLVH